MHRFVNNMKTAMLLGGMMALFVAVGASWGKEGMILGLLFGGALNFVAWFFSDKIAIAAMRGKAVGPDDRGVGGELYRMVDDLRQRAGLPMPKVYICPHEAPNAFATGRSPRNAAVAVTEGALRLLDRHELAGVMAHELAHVKNRDTLISCIAATISGVLAFLAQWGLLLGGHRNSNPFVLIITVIVAAVGAAIIKAMISRSREFVADADGAAIAGTPDGLIGALARLEAYSKRIPLHQPNPAMNNLFIIEPLTGNQVLRLFATHPPTEARIEALRSLRTR